jgi:transposase
MPYPTKLISEELFNKALLELDALGRYGKLSTRLQLIVISKNLSISGAARALGFNRVSVAKWIKRFDKEGISGLEDRCGKGRKTLINPKIISELQRLIKQDSQVTLKKLKIEIQNKFDITLSKSTIHNYVKSLGFAHITGRPKHYKQNKEKLEEFKKNSKRNQSTKS